MNAPIRVVVSDAAAAVRAGLAMLIDREPDMTVVGLSGDDDTDLVREVTRLSPDVVVVDVDLPLSAGLDSTRQLLAASRNARLPLPAVLVLTQTAEHEDLLEAVRAGACGFLLKNTRPEVLVDAIRVLRCGGSFVDPSMTDALLRHCLRLERMVAGPMPRNPAVPSASSAPTSVSRLTGRERDVLEGLARGWSNRRVARELCVSEGTVKTHVSHLLAKLNLESRAQAVVVAYESGLVAR